MPKANDSTDTKTAMVQPAALPPNQEAAAKAQIANLPPNIPRVDPKTSNLPQVQSFPPDSEFSGAYTKISDGEDYALAVVENDPLERSHKAKNSVHTWEGTKSEFRDQFDVKDNDKRAPKDDDKK
jgi:hypothetical protein